MGQLAGQLAGQPVICTKAARWLKAISHMAWPLQATESDRKREKNPFSGAITNQGKKYLFLCWPIRTKQRRLTSIKRFLGGSVSIASMRAGYRERTNSKRCRGAFIRDWRRCGAGAKDGSELALKIQSRYSISPPVWRRSLRADFACDVKCSCTRGWLG